MAACRQKNQAAQSRVNYQESEMRAIDCPCGHHFVAADDEELFGLFAAGASTAGLVLGGLLLAACATVTATNLRLPSELFAWLERRRASTTNPITTRKGAVR
jgi:hypothetical protein